MNYIILAVLLFIAEVGYFAVADKYNIIDKPNLRSSHTTLTLRGGGVVFYCGAVAYFLYSGFQYPWFFLGLTLMTLVSFLDDVFTLSNKLRLAVHFVSVFLLFNELSVFNLGAVPLICGFIVIVGIVNAYNFMDGINGMTACYSISVIGLLLIVNSTLHFVDSRLLVYVLIGALVFSYFNFRNLAKTFAGDVGAVSMAFLLVFCLATLILKSENLIYLLFLTVYGIDAVWTIIRRLSRKENIFQAHRSHLYQLLANEAGVNKLVVSFMYGLVQFLIGLLVLMYDDRDRGTQIIVSICIIVFSSIIYMIILRSISKKIS